jgi:hypothetical protein
VPARDGDDRLSEREEETAQPFRPAGVIIDQDDLASVSATADTRNRRPLESATLMMVSARPPDIRHFARHRETRPGTAPEPEPLGLVVANEGAPFSGTMKHRPGSSMTSLPTFGTLAPYAAKLLHISGHCGGLRGRQGMSWATELPQLRAASRPAGQEAAAGLC